MQQRASVERLRAGYPTTGPWHVRVRVALALAVLVVLSAACGTTETPVASSSAERAEAAIDAGAAEPTTPPADATATPEPTEVAEVAPTEVPSDVAPTVEPELETGTLEEGEELPSADDGRVAIYGSSTTKSTSCADDDAELMLFYTVTAAVVWPEQPAIEGLASVDGEQFLQIALVLEQSAPCATPQQLTDADLSTLEGYPVTVQPTTFTVDVPFESAAVIAVPADAERITLAIEGADTPITVEIPA